jgi:DNA-binding SARP family transcriptional activator
VRYWILGPLELTRDDGAQSVLPRARLRSLLTVFLVHPNSLVSTDRLLYLLYGDSAPANGVHTVHSYASTLRRLLLPWTPLLNERPGYRFVLDPADLDMNRFRELASSGSQSLNDGVFKRAASELDQACRLWRDVTLPDFPQAPPMAQVAESLVSELRVVRELLVDAKLALGRSRELLSDLQAMVLADPCGERAWAQLMLARYRSDLRAEALETYLLARTSLQEFAGISPGPLLKQLHGWMLRDDPALAAPIPWRAPASAS